MIDGDNRDPIITARQAAEALFAQRPDVTEQAVSNPAQPSNAHKPQILPALAPAPVRRDPTYAVKASAPPPVLRIPARKSARIRTLVKYGMTVGQVAEVYGMPVETVERLLRKS
jgi:hypothetical protein